MRLPVAAVLLVLAFAVHAAPKRVWHLQSPPSHVDFGVRLLWLHTIHGRFEHIAGTVERQADGRVVVDARVAVDSLTMDSPRLRRWVLGDDFFNAARYPLLHFVSAPTPRATLDTGGALAGQLTLRGITRPMQLELLPARCTADACMIEGRGQLQRGDFGMTSHHTVLSDRVELALSIAIARQPD
jgi:polyisoprenoid-binding protein YceI